LYALHAALLSALSKDAPGCGFGTLQPIHLRVALVVAIEGRRKHAKLLENAEDKSDERDPHIRNRANNA
jgi:hypothetical protein